MFGWYLTNKQTLSYIILDAYGASLFVIIDLGDFYMNQVQLYACDYIFSAHKLQLYLVDCKIS